MDRPNAAPCDYSPCHATAGGPPDKPDAHSPSEAATAVQGRPLLGHELSVCAVGDPDRSSASQRNLETATAADSPGTSDASHNGSTGEAGLSQRVKSFLELPDRAAATADSQNGKADESAADDAWAPYMLPEDVLSKWGNVLDIVTPESQATNCFTKTYSQYAKVSWARSCNLSCSF